MRYFKTFTFISFLFIFSQSFSQSSEDADATNVFKITVVNPGISYESPIMKHQTLYAQAFMNLSATFTEDTYYGTSETNFYIDPALTGQYRFYYNFNRRAEKEKRVEMNSANYIAAVYEGIYSKVPLSGDYIEETERRIINRVGTVWGMQRNYKSRISLDLNVGLGYMFGKSTEFDYYSQQAHITSTTEGQITLLGQINVGIWLNSRPSE